MVKLATRIVDKPWGQTDLPAMFGDHGDRRVGEIWFEHPGGEPLAVMIKYLFTSERLSIQVHPNDAQARDRGHPRGKEEAWVVLEADEGAHLGVGLKAPSDSETLRAAALSGAIEEMMDWRPAEKGQFVYNPAGTIHAIGPGLVILEVQQNVDLTYRLYDYGRPRELHLDDGIAVTRPVPHADPRDTMVPPAGSVTLVEGPHFGLARIEGPGWSPPAGIEGPLQVAPLGQGVTVDGEAVAQGECALAGDFGDVSVPEGVQAFVAWGR